VTDDEIESSYEVHRSHTQIKASSPIRLKLQYPSPPSFLSFLLSPFSFLLSPFSFLLSPFSFRSFFPFSFLSFLLSFLSFSFLLSFLSFSFLLSFLSFSFLLSFLSFSFPSFLLSFLFFFLFFDFAEYGAWIYVEAAYGRADPTRHFTPISTKYNLLSLSLISSCSGTWGSGVVVWQGAW
jgi:hypothetical protein